MSSSCVESATGMVSLGVMTGAPVHIWSGAGVVGAESSSESAIDVGAVAESDT